MIPHKSKKFRAILDLSFCIEHDNQTYKSVNDATTPLAPQQSMGQLGKILKRLISSMADNYNPAIPFLFSKMDIKDGFWQLRVNSNDAWNFSYILPNKHKRKVELDDIEIVVPCSL